jgi:hypothetical protein
MAEIDKLKSLLDSDDEYDNDYEAQEVFRRVYLVHDYADGDRMVPTSQCGSFKFKNTPKALYRLLFLARPKRINFDDMYKSTLFALTSVDGRFVADFDFYKYKLAAYLSATAEHIEGRNSMIMCGVPGANNGIRIKTPELQMWADTLKKCLNKKWMIYGGNDFEV